MELNVIHNQDCLEGLRALPDNSIDCCVTSPPYYGLRDYGLPKTMWPTVEYSPLPGVGKIHVPEWEGHLGLEPTIEMFIGHIALIFREVQRVLKKDGTLWFNFGDSYAGSQKGASNYPDSIKDSKQAGYKDGIIGSPLPVPKVSYLKIKDLMGIPWRAAFTLQVDGWYLRQDIIWSKPNPMPESVKDRCTKSHEYIFLLSKSKKYYYDALSIATSYADKTFTTFGCPNSGGTGDGTGLIKSENRRNTVPVRKPKQWKTPDGWDTGKGSHGSFHKDGREKGAKGYEHRGTGDKGITGHSGNYDSDGNLIGDGRANKKSVWTVSTKPFTEAHFATFPQDLIVDCIKAGCPEGGIVLDPFMGAGTTAVVARKLNRNYIGFELNPEYIKIAERRLYKELGMYI